MKGELRIGKKEVLVLVVISISLFVYQIKQISYYHLRDKEAGDIKPETSYYRTSVESKLLLARLNHYYLYSKFDENLKLYSEALKICPVYLQAWISLADLLIDNRLNDKAKTVMKYVNSIAGLSITELWDISLLALKLNEPEIAVKNIAIYSQAVPFYEWDRGFRIIDKLDRGVELFVRYADDMSIVNFLNYAISANSFDNAAYTWSYITKNKIEVSHQLKIDYVNYLLAHNQPEQALSIWKGIFPDTGYQDGNLVWNGGFESEIVNKGFDWNIVPVKGVKVQVDTGTHFSGTRSLMINFSGDDNLQYGQVSQLIPIKNRGKYVLEFAYRSKDITTESGLYVELSCDNVSESSLKSDMITGDNNWHKQKLRFNAGNDCLRLKLSIKRDSIIKIDSKISGTAWFDDFKLTRTG